jgi:hypothetical protein
MINLERTTIRNLGALLWVLSFGSCAHKKVTAEQVERRISTAVPAGTERNRVLAILDSLKLEHSAFDEKTRTIAAMVPDSSKKAMITRSFHITLVFDTAGRLSSHTIKEIFTGP